MCNVCQPAELSYFLQLSATLITDYVTDGANLNQMSLTGHFTTDLRLPRTLDRRQTTVDQVNYLLRLFFFFFFFNFMIEQYIMQYSPQDVTPFFP